MRIVCQKCSAAYAIDDKHVTPKGVRAQCPRCRHLQLVKKEEAPAPAAAPAPGADLHFGQTAPSAAGAASPFDFGAPPPGPAASPFDFGAPPAPAPSPAAFDFGAPPPAASPGAGAAFDFGAPAPSASPGGAASFDFGAPPPAASPAPGSAFDFGAPPSGRGAFDFGGPPPGPAGGSGGLDPFAGQASTAPGAGGSASSDIDELLGAAPAPTAAAAGVPCKACGKSLTDPLDQALGHCDDCRARGQESGGSAEPSAPRAVPEPLFSPPAPPAPLFPPAAAPDVAGARSAQREARAPMSRKNLAIVGAVAVALVGAIVLVVKRPWARRAPPTATRPAEPSGRPVEGIIQQWRLQYPELEKASFDQLVDEGEALLLKDTTQGYKDAEEAFQQALVLKPSSDRALAGWVFSLAFGRGPLIDDQTAQAAESMLLKAEERGRELRVFVAHAHFLIARNGNPNDIKVLAERGLASEAPGDRALAALAVGQTQITRNPTQAEKSFEDALASDAKIKRAHFFRAQLAVSQGQYKKAVESLERRLELDADQWEAAEELARLLVDVGELPRAKKVLEAALAADPRAGRPRLALAMLSYQHLGDLGGAAQQLQGIIADQEVSRQERADALLHLAAIQRIGGEATRAADTLERGLELTPDSVPLKLQRLLLLLDRSVASTARMEFDALKGKLADKQLEATLEGKLLLIENRLDDAMQKLGAVAEADPRRADALLLAGTAAARARKDGKAWEFCLKRGLKADPYSRPMPTLTHLVVRPEDILSSAQGAYLALEGNADEDPNPALCEGLVAWFQGDLATADRQFARVMAIDARAPEASAYRALGALKRRENGAALKYASRAVAGGRTSALAHFALAQVLAATKKPDHAKVEAAQALQHGPHLLGAKVMVADGDATHGSKEDARRALTTVLLVDPTYRDAKRVLYLHGL